MTFAKHVNRHLPASDLPRLFGRPSQTAGKTGRLVVIPHNCTGCRTCELACSFVHSTGGFLGRSRITVHSANSSKSDERYVQVTCLQCVEAACAKCCPTEALVRNQDSGAIELKAGRCIGCGLCEAVCPFGHMHFDRESKLPTKCDLCSGQPACAAFCPHGALEIR